jgi:putative sterol carrier protein
VTSPTEEFFEALKRVQHEPLVIGVTGTVRFNLTTEADIEVWTLGIDRGDIRVSHDSGPADCVVTTSRPDFDAIVSGQLNALAAMLRGTLVVTGDPQVLVLVQRLFPGPTDDRRRQPVAMAGDVHGN